MNIHAILRTICGIGECELCGEPYFKLWARLDKHAGFCCRSCEFRVWKLRTIGERWKTQYITFIEHEDGGHDVNRTPQQDVGQEGGT